MKIAIVTTDDRQTFRDYGSTRPRYEKAQQALLEGFAHFPEHEIHVISCLQQPVTTVKQIAENVWCHSLHVPKIGWLRTLYQGCIRATRRKLRELQPDIVHGQGTERDCGLNAVFSGFPNVITIHGNMKAIAEVEQGRLGGYYWWAAKLETPALRKTAGVFCNSAYTEQLVAPRARRIWRVPNAIRSAFLDRPFSRKPTALPIILNVGVLGIRKRQLELLNMAQRLWNQGFRFQLQFAGTAESRNDYNRSFLKQISEAEKVGYAKHLGVLNLDELTQHMDSAEAMIHFPVEESFGLVVAEALARNLKFFGSAVGGIQEICKNVEAAELFPVEDWKNLEKSVADWLRKGLLRPLTAANTIQQRYSPRTVAQRHLEIYREVLGK